MSEYIGEKCIVCNAEFKKHDDIVVCPECGTPYHRECYNKEGKCINNILHANNKTWKSKHKDDSINKIKCSVCETENPDTALFCSGCGKPLMNLSRSSVLNQYGFPSIMGSSNNLPPHQKVITEDSEIDGIKVRDYSDYVGSNKTYFILNFLKFSRNRKISLNFVAFIFPQLYFFYRKMNLAGIIFMVISMLTQIPVLYTMARSGYFDETIFVNMFTTTLSTSTMDILSSISSLINTTTMLTGGLFANWFYYLKAKKDILNIRSLDIPEGEKSALIQYKGGPSFKNLFAFVLAQMILMLTIVFAYTLFN